jgi:hypothetical protein
VTPDRDQEARDAFIAGWIAGMELRVRRLEARVKQLKAWQEGWDGPSDAVARGPALSTRK